MFHISYFISIETVIFNSSKILQLLNIFFISVTFSVLKQERSNFFNYSQPVNIKLISVTFSVLKSMKFISFIDEQVKNI